jgi:hypothetical protein
MVQKSFANPNLLSSKSRTKLLVELTKKPCQPQQVTDRLNDSLKRLIFKQQEPVLSMPLLHQQRFTQ